MRKVRQKTIKSRILAIAVIFMLIGIAITVTACNILMVKTSKKNTNDTLNLVGRYCAEQINSWLVEEKQLTEGVSSAIQFAEPNSLEDTKTLLSTYADGREEVLDLYYGKADTKAFVKYANTEVPEGYDCTQRGWWKAATAAGETVVTSPYVDAFTGLMCITIASPIYRNGTLEGVVGLDVALDEVQTIVESMFTQEYTGFLVDNEGNILIHQNQEYLPTEDKTVAFGEILPTVCAGTVDGDNLLSATDYTGKKQIFAVAEVLLSGWKVVTHMEYSKCYTTVYYAVSMALLTGLIVVSISYLIMKNVFRKAFAPIDQMKEFVIERIIGKNNYKPEKTEVKDIIQLVNSMSTEFMGTISATQTEAGKIQNEVQGATKKMEDMNNSITSISASIEETSASIDLQTENISEISSSCEEVALTVQKITDETANMLERVNDISEKVAELTKEMGEKIAKAKSLSVRSTERLQSAIAGIAVIGEIGALADTINGVAENTNLLALNASIEAARAGEAGRGFAVVAEEIGKLSTETTTRVDEVYRIVGEAVKNADELRVECENVLTYLAEEVLADYDSFAKTITAYKEDCDYYAKTSTALANEVSQISESIQEVNSTLASIADSQVQLNQTVSEVGDSLNDMVSASYDTANAFTMVGEASDTLAETVQKFNL